MFNRDGLFGKKDDTPQHSRVRGSVNVTPGLNPTGAGAPRQPSAHLPETARPDLRYSESTRPAARTEEPTGSRLVVGRDIKLKGAEITDCDTLVVEGRVEASMDARAVQIAESGVFSGTVNVDLAEIRGRFEGDLTARKQLVIHSTGRVTGRIRYGGIRIEEGGELAGDISTLQATTAASAVTVLATAIREPQAAQPEPTLPASEADATRSPQTSTVPPILGSRAPNQNRTGTDPRF